MKLRSPLLLTGLLLVAAPFAANADLPGKHPFYLHALSDLRSARWLIEHRPGDAAVSGVATAARSAVSEESVENALHAVIALRVRKESVASAAPARIAHRVSAPRVATARRVSERLAPIVLVESERLVHRASDPRARRESGQRDQPAPKSPSR